MTTLAVESPRKGTAESAREVQRRAIALEILPNLGLLLTDEFLSVLIPRPAEKIIFGGWRAGKSTLLALNVFLEILLAALDKRPRLYWLIMPDYMTKPEEMRYLYEWGVKCGLSPRIHRPEGASWRVVFYGGRVVVETRTATNPEGIASVACDGVTLCEAGQMGPSIRDHALGRVMDRRGWVEYGGTLEDDEAKPRYDWYAELGAEWLETMEPDKQAFSLPSWANAFVFPEGRNDPAILYREKEYSSAKFQRYICGVPAGPQWRLYEELDSGDWGYMESERTAWNYSRGAGGHDYGEGFADNKHGHPSTLVAVQVTQGDIAVVREVWEDFSGDVNYIEAKRSQMSRDWRISKRRWAYDPMQREAAKILGAQIAPETLRLTRAGMVHNRLMDRHLLFDMVIMPGDSPATRGRKEEVRRCFMQMRRVHQVKKPVVGQGYKYVYARVDDDMAAGVEGAIAVIDTRRSFPMGGTLPGLKVPVG